MTQIQIRRGAAAAWTSANPVLAQGEMGYEIDTQKIKVGNGSTAWNSLSYFPVAWSALNGAPAVIAAGATQADARSAISAASLDQNGKVPVSELPASLMQYVGVWNASTNSPSLVDGTGNIGDVYRVTVAGSRNLGSGSITFNVGDYVILNSDNVWERSDTTDAVSTVAGRTGDVTLTVADISGDTSTALGVGSLELGHASDTTLTRSAAGVVAVEGVDLVKTNDSRLSNARTPTAAGQVADLSIVAFGANTARAASSYGDFPFGVKLQRAVTLTSVTYRAATADASGNLVVELRKNGSTVTGSSATIAAASQVAGGTATGTWSFAAGDIVTVYITAAGTTPGKGLIADITGVTA